jgi:hypothetical protein
MILGVVALIVALLQWQLPDPLGIDNKGLGPPLPSIASGTTQLSGSETSDSHPVTTVAHTSPPRKKYDVRMGQEDHLDVDSGRKFKLHSQNSDLMWGPKYGLQAANKLGVHGLGQPITLKNCLETVGDFSDGKFKIEFSELTEGLTFCIPTSEARVAGITVLSKPLTEAGSIILRVVLW